jgi:hypothetical protein
MATGSILETADKIEIGDRVFIKVEHRKLYEGRRAVEIGGKEEDIVNLNLVVRGQHLNLYWLGTSEKDKDPISVDRLHVDRVNRDPDGW